MQPKAVLCIFLALIPLAHGQGFLYHLTQFPQRNSFSQGIRNINFGQFSRSSSGQNRLSEKEYLSPYRNDKDTSNYFRQNSQFFNFPQQEPAQYHRHGHRRLFQRRNRQAAQGNPFDMMYN